jgi:hypothetical protein
LPFSTQWQNIAQTGIQRPILLDSQDGCSSEPRHPSGETRGGPEKKGAGELPLVLLKLVRGFRAAHQVHRTDEHQRISLVETLWRNGQSFVGRLFFNRDGFTRGVV